MDDNKKLLPIPPEEGDKKKKSRKKKGLSKNTVSAIYMGVALCMVFMLTLSLATATGKVQDSVDELELDGISLPDVSLPMPDTHISSGDNVAFGDDSKTDAPPHQDKPVGGDVSGVTDEVLPPEESEDPDKSEAEPTAVYVRPLRGELIKGYSMDSLVFSETMQDFRVHGGIDIAAELGAEVLAYTDGVVSKVEQHPFMGTTVEIVHEAGVSSLYQNLSAELPTDIKVGAAVKAGDVIGTVGDTAILEIADVPHLHFELWMNGDSINAEREISLLK
ncbi:MAG: M23 family metallopeptidase [Ruminococcaceae bacterium]|nr:M23 family metallopeptidase [Oscillospiraceae bacterium]